jgi:dephospho-CoA kinase
MLRVAVTGGIGTGKSVVLEEFAACGAPVVDADALVHDALRRGAPGIGAIRARFGPDVINEAGDVDRARLGSLVFADAEARRDLEALLHPAVYRAIDAWMADRDRDGAPLAVAEIPLLFETGHEAEFDCVVVTACDEDAQLRRALGRPGATEADARRRIAAQWPLAEKVRRADYVIRTDGALDDTRRQARTIYELIARRARVNQAGHAPRQA